MYRRPVRRLLWAVTMDSLAVGLVCFLRPSSVLELTVARPSRGRGTWGPVYFLRLAGCALAGRGGELRPAGIVGGSPCLCTCRNRRLQATCSRPRPPPGLPGRSRCLRLCRRTALSSCIRRILRTGRASAVRCRPRLPLTRLRPRSSISIAKARPCAWRPLFLRDGLLSDPLPVADSCLRRIRVWIVCTRPTLGALVSVLCRCRLPFYMTPGVCLVLPS